MREELEQILNHYQFEFNNEITRNEIKSRLSSYLNTQISNHRIVDFKVEDKTTIINFENQNETGVYFQIFYQIFRWDEIRVIDIMLYSNSVIISDFENNVVGKRLIPKLKL